MRATNYFFTSDEHYYHYNVIKYNNRPFSSIEEMNEGLIQRFNRKVSNSPNNITIHCGDFCWQQSIDAFKEIVSRLNGKHVFLKGSHDYWMRCTGHHYNQIWEKKIGGKYIVACHYLMTVWPRSHYGSWLVYGHSHGRFVGDGKCFDVGVDNCNYEPISLDELTIIMNEKEDNVNLIKGDNR